MTLRDFHEIFEVGIALRDVFISKKLDTSQKPRQFAIRFYIQKSGTLRYTIFYWIFETYRGGGVNTGIPTTVKPPLPGIPLTV